MSHLRFNDASLVLLLLAVLCAFTDRRSGALHCLDIVRLI